MSTCFNTLLVSLRMSVRVAVMLLKYTLLALSQGHPGASYGVVWTENSPLARRHGQAGVRWNCERKDPAKRSPRAHDTLLLPLFHSEWRRGLGRGGAFSLEAARFLVCGCGLPTGGLLSPTLSSRGGKRGGGGARPCHCDGWRSRAQPTSGSRFFSLSSILNGGEGWGEEECFT